jgi:hypothetical protein
MRVFARLSKFLSLTAAAVAGSLCFGTPALAGGGGEDASTAQSVLNMICSDIGFSPCPQLPTVSQIVLEISGLINSPPDDVRAVFLVNCGSFLFTPCPPVVDPANAPVAVNAVNAPVKSPSASASVAISYLTPLAFKPGPAVTQYGDPTATRFFYATLLEGPNGQPEALDIILDDTLGTSKQFSKGPVIAFSLPLVVLKGGTEYPVAATLQLTATCNGAASCLTGTVTGTFPGVGKQTYPAAALGVSFGYSFGASPNSTTSHALYELQLPLLVTLNSDDAYFDAPPYCPNNGTDKIGTNPASGYCNAFATSQPGFSAPVLGSGASIGVAPYAAPLCPGNTCPTTAPATTFFGFCASFATGPAAGPGVATFLQIGTDGRTAITTPVSTQGIQCPS